MAFARPDEESKAFLASVLPVDPRVTTKPMFGNLGSFIKGNMFAGLYGQQVFIRLPDTDRLRLIEEEGATEFSPMPGKPMKEYVAIPEKWRQNPEAVREWMNRSLEWVEAMPEKLPAKKKAKK